MPIPESNLSHSTFWVKFEIYHTPAPQSAQISNNMYQPGGIFACGGADVYDIEHSVLTIDLCCCLKYCIIPMDISVTIIWVRNGRKTIVSAETIKG